MGWGDALAAGAAFFAGITLGYIIRAILEGVR